MYFISHDDRWKSNYLSMAADQELADDQLPAGETPIWIQPPRGATQFEMLKRVKTMAGKYQDVMVLYYYGSDDERAAAWCRERGWKYHRADNIYGTEAQVVVLLECYLEPEFITRGINQLIIVGTESG